MKVLSFENIKKLYPEEWVLIGNPELKNPEIEASYSQSVSEWYCYFS